MHRHLLTFLLLLISAISQSATCASNYATISDNIQVNITGTDPTGAAAQLVGLNRDKTLVNTGSVEQDVKGMMESQALMQARKELAAAASKLGFQIAGDVANSQMGAYNPETQQYENPGWEEGGKYRTLLHMGVAAVSAALADGDIGQAALAAGLNQLSHKFIDDFLVENNIVVGSPEGNAIAKAISTAIGAIISQGNVNVAQITNNATEFNRQLHRAEGQWIRDNVGGFIAMMKAKGITLTREEALARLSRAALKKIDAAQNDNFGSREDEHANAYLAKIAGKPIGNSGQRFFLATEAERNNHQLNAGHLLENLDLYDSAGYAMSIYGEMIPDTYDQRRGGNAVMIALRSSRDNKGGTSPEDMAALRQSISELSVEEKRDLVRYVLSNYQANSLNFVYLDQSLEDIGLVKDRWSFLSDYTKSVLQDEREAFHQNAIITSKIARGEKLTAQEKEILGAMFAVGFAGRSMTAKDYMLVQKTIIQGISSSRRPTFQDNHILTIPTQVEINRQRRVEMAQMAMITVMEMEARMVRVLSRASRSAITITITAT